MACRPSKASVAALLTASLLTVSCKHYVISPVFDEAPPSEEPRNVLMPSGAAGEDAPPMAVPTSTELPPGLDAGALAALEALEKKMTFREDMPQSIGKDDPAHQNANASSEHCRKEVTKRALSVTRVKSAAKGIADTYRLSGSMNGVKLLAPEGKHGLLDCRLVLAIDDFTKVLAEFSVTQIRIDNFYRAGAKLPGQKKASQHAAGLAIDMTTMTLADGRTLTMSDWGAVIGDKPCGPDAVMNAPTEASVELRNLVCEVGRRKIFHTVLSPSFNQAHQSHFHLDIKKDSTFASVR